MEPTDKIIKTIFKAIDQVNKKLSARQQIEKSVDAAWLGPSSTLDSLGFVFLIVAIENNIKKDFGVTIRIMSDMITSQKNGPLLSAGTLAKHISSLLGAQPKQGD